jgi:hypothetical protein
VRHADHHLNNYRRRQEKERDVAGWKITFEIREEEKEGAGGKEHHQ